MNKLKISDSDKRLLLIFFAIVIVACSYFFIFNKGMSKAAKIEEQNTTDRAKVQQMEQMEAGLPKVKENIQTMQKKQKDIIAAYPADMKTEKVIETLQEFEDKSSNFHITDVTFAMNMPIGADNSIAAADGSAAASTDTTEDTTTTQETQTTESADTQSTESTESTPENTTGPTGNVEGYYASIGIRYEASYEGLKDMIAYVNKFKDRTTIAQFSASFDNSTGKLTGDMTLNMYYLENTGKDYVPPVFENMPKGVNNIFGGSSSETAEQ